MTVKTLTTTSLITGALFFSVFTPRAFADTCQPTYGGGQTCVPGATLLLNKTVANPKTGSFVDNLGVNDPRYGPESTVTFQLHVTNTSTIAMPEITVTDTFPQFVNFVSGAGSFDPGTKKLTFTLANLAPSETRTFTLTGKIAKTTELPGDQNITCVVNQAVATFNGANAQDNAQLCIEKTLPTPTPLPTSVTSQPGKSTQPGQTTTPGGGQTVTTTKGGIPVTTVPVETKGGQKIFPQPVVTKTPPTGPEMLSLLGLIPTGILGHFLRKRSYTGK